MTREELEEIEQRLSATTQGKWIADGNFPFYVNLKKPAPSLSKHDLEQPTFWKYQDAEFVLMAHNQDMPRLIQEIKKLKGWDINPVEAQDI